MSRREGSGGGPGRGGGPRTPRGRLMGGPGRLGFVGGGPSVSGGEAPGGPLAPREPSPSAPAAILAPTDGLAQRVRERALELTVATLKGYRNQVSEAHRRALDATLGLFTEIASGERRGRYVVDLPTG